MNFKVLNTRPAPQGPALSKDLHALGFDVIEFCPIIIQPVADLHTQLASRQIALNLDDFSDIIITSGFAATLGLDFLSDFWPQWPVTNWWAIGHSTAQKVKAFGINPKQPLLALPTDQAYSFQSANSEAVLQALWKNWKIPNVLQELTTQSTLIDTIAHRKKVLVLAGKKGRGLIQTELNKQAIHVKTLECYERVKNTQSMIFEPMDAVILTSVDIASCILLDQNSLDQLGHHCHFICASTRIAEFVRSKGAMKVVNSGSASNKILSETLEQLLC